MTMHQYCLRWNNHQPNFISVFSSLLNNESLVDVTLAAEGRHLQAHKVVLSACSSYFQSLFTINPCQHPIVILKDVKFSDLKVMVDFMYYGEVNVSQEQLPHILKTAEMLKIKGLAEIPVEQSSLVKSQSSSTERPELLTPGDSNWSSDCIQRQSLSPSPCPLSPASKRKRLRKSSTGSGSGSTERPAAEEQPPVEAMLMSPGGSTTGTVIKPDPGGFSSDCSSSTITRGGGKMLSGESDGTYRGSSSHESLEGDVPHQITLQVPQQEVPHSLEQVTPVDMQTAAPSVSQQASAERMQLFQQLPSSQHLVMGTKRGRFLMRQQRIKRESDSNQALDADCSPQYLSVPQSYRIERQTSDPLPSSSPPASLNLLTVPGGGMLVKQHSHPLLPSQTQSQSVSGRQLRASPPAPLHIQVLSHLSTPISMSHTAPSSSSHIVEAERAVSPIVVISDPLSTSPHGTVPALRADTAASSVPATATLRVRTDELTRSASSPQEDTAPRSSHCPAVRSGPALGCNYCWNTVDTHGRILRRKTKYHCPECQTNLCIVPCFQEYHERHVPSSQADPLALTTSVMRTIFPKTGSM